MLVLTRKPEERLIFELPDGRTLSVMVLKVRGDQVSLGADAPQDIGVWREEVWRRLSETEKEVRRGRS